MNRFLFPCALALSLLFTPLSGRAADKPAEGIKHIEDVIYGRKFGTALTMDVFQPAQPNGCGVIFVVSGGWYSGHDGLSVKHTFIGRFLEHGYTVFAVVHGSQPKFTIPEIVEDMQRSVRFIRVNAAKYGVNPDKLGVTGGSAGGHLSLMLGTLGGPGNPKAKDPIDRESSAVQAVACFFPPTDFLNYGKPGEDAVGVGILKDFKPAFGPRADKLEDHAQYGREISPIYHITPKLPPTLIIHGDADLLVPIQQAETFLAKAKEAGVPTKLITKPGKKHGWDSMSDDTKELADWFDLYLRDIKK